MRQYRRREQRRLFWIVAAFLVVVGGLAIGLVYGLQSVILGVICLLAGAAVLALLWLILLFMERLAE
jgi:Na+/proline symporter